MGLNLKSQIGIFLVVGILIILILVFFIFQKSDILKKDLEIDEKKSFFENTNFDQIKDYVEICLKESSKEALYMISNNGGYVSSIGDQNFEVQGDGNPFFDQAYFNGFVYPYVYDGEIIMLREFFEIENLMSNYTSKSFSLCINNFSFYNDTNITIKYENVTSENFEFIFNQENTVIELDWELNLKALDEEKTFKKYIFNHDGIRFKKIYNIIQKILVDLKNNGEEFNINFNCEDYIEQNEKKINIYLISNKEKYDYLLSIIDSKPTPYEVPFKFNVGVKNIKLTGGCYGF